MANTLSKNAAGYGYKYTDLAQINKFIESIGETYYQYIDTDENGNDYIVTVREKNGNEIRKIRGCRIISAALSGKNNPVQEYGAGITYIRRYSLLMAYGLACEGDDAATFTEKKAKPKTKPVKKETKPEPTMTSAQVDDLQGMLDKNNLNAKELFGMEIVDMPSRYFERAVQKIKEVID